MEVLNQLIIAHELQYLDKESFLELRLKIEKIANLLNALRKSQLKND